jgi:hypothetical protein
MKTAVEWFVEEMFNQGYLNDKPLTVNNIEYFVKQAKEMEKEQIIDTFYNARKNKSDCQIWNCEGSQKTYETFEQYYNETFKSE